MKGPRSKWLLILDTFLQSESARVWLVESQQVHCKAIDLGPCGTYYKKCAPCLVRVGHCAGGERRQDQGRVRQVALRGTWPPQLSVGVAFIKLVHLVGLERE